MVRGMDVCEEETVEEIINNVPEEDEIKQVIENRENMQKFSNDQMFRQGAKELSEELEDIRDALLKKDGIVSVEKQDLFREQLQRTFSNDLIKAMSCKKGPKVARLDTINNKSQISNASTVGVDDDDDDDDESIHTEDEVPDEEEKKEEEDDDNDNDDEEEANPDDDIDQVEINRNWIKALDVNYPLKTYYKNIKKNLQIVLGSERIPSRQYPKWSENLYVTFKKVA